MTTDLPQDLPDRSPQPSPDAGPPLPAATEAVPNRGLGPRSGWARGAFAMFAPEQQTQLQADIVSPEGRILFAGEHCSLYHA